MEIPTDLSGILSEFGLPIGAGALAYGLVRGAEALEKDAKEERLRYISNLLTDRSFTSYGKLGASVVPFVFERVFGSDPISIKFIFRSILASIIFWCLLLIVRHASLIVIPWTVFQAPSDVMALVFIDWFCLVKSKFILDVMSKRFVMFWSITFVLIDLFFMSVILLIIVMLEMRDLPVTRAGRPLGRAIGPSEARSPTAWPNTPAAGATPGHNPEDEPTIGSALYLVGELTSSLCPVEAAIVEEVILDQ